MNTNLNELVVAIYARAAMDRRETGTSDLSVAAAKLRNNIRHGKAVDPVEGIPAKYIPDWTALHNREESVGEDSFAQAWTTMNDRRQALYTELTGAGPPLRIERRHSIKKPPRRAAKIDKTWRVTV